MCAWRQVLRITVMTGALCACAPNESPFKGSNLIRVVPGGPSLSVVNAKTESEARPWATEYCNKQGLAARFKGMGMRWRSTSAEYDCL
jgi:hypothetical protein